MKRHVLLVCMDVMLGMSLALGNYLYSYTLPGIQAAAVNPDASVIMTEAQGENPDASGTTTAAQGENPDASGTTTASQGTNSDASDIKSETTGIASNAAGTDSNAGVITPVPAGGNAGTSDAVSNQADWGVKFSSHFSDTVISTSNSYKDSNISVDLTWHSTDTKRSDSSEGGKHLSYGTKSAYVLADIYIKSINCLRTAFARGKYGVGFAESLPSMSKRIKSVLGINGDSYSNNLNMGNGTIIRNGRVYRKNVTSAETCVLFKDGTMKTYLPEEFSADTVIAQGAWQSWIFGPSLLTADGKAKTDFLTRPYIRESHPRTAIGYYEPGHYCFLVVDGRKAGYSRGMFLDEMSKVFADLGCKAAYNLDGGHCSFMTLGITIANNPYKAQHAVSDGIFLCSPGGNTA